MHKVVIFGNSGSGKSTLAREKARALGCVHLDLDTVAWEEGCVPPSRRPLSESQKLIEAFLTHGESWVVEGCYSDLLELVIPYCDEVIFLNPGVEVCAANCSSRPWEPHKYDSTEEQDTNLPKRVTIQAFLNAPHTEHTEQFIVRALRAANALTISLVAETQEEIVGHVAVSPVTISDGSEGWFGLGPISVLPAHQRSGGSGPLDFGAWPRF